MRRPSAGFLVTAGFLIFGLVAYVAHLWLEARSFRHDSAIDSCARQHAREENLGSLSEFLRSLSPGDRATAIRTLAMMKHRRSKELVVAQARAKSPAVRRAVQYYISRLQLAEHKDVAVSYLLDPKPSVRKGAFDAFVMSFPEAKPIMASMAESDPDPECRELAATFVDSVPTTLPRKYQDRKDAQPSDGSGATGDSEGREE